MSLDLITEVVNTVEALCEAGIATYAQAAKETGISDRTLYAWFGKERRYRPSADHYFKLRDWAAKQTAKLSRAGETTKQTREMHSRYRLAFKEVSARFPVNGKNE